MDRQKIEQRRAIKFRVNLGESATVAHGEIPYPGHEPFPEGREIKGETKLLQEDLEPQKRTTTWKGRGLL
jgi:hypothetical protein